MREINEFRGINNLGKKLETIPKNNKNFRKFQKYRFKGWPKLADI